MGMYERVWESQYAAYAGCTVDGGRTEYNGK